LGFVYNVTLAEV